MGERDGGWRGGEGGECECVVILLLRMDMEEQAEDLQTMHDRRMQQLHRSIKKQQARKRRRVDEEEEDEEEEEGEGKAKRRWAVVEANLREKVHELEEEMELERNRCKLWGVQVSYSNFCWG